MNELIKNIKLILLVTVILFLLLLVTTFAGGFLLPDFVASILFSNFWLITFVIFIVLLKNDKENPEKIITGKIVAKAIGLTIITVIMFFLLFYYITSIYYSSKP